MSRRQLRTMGDLGISIRDARLRAGLTQVELAKKADVSREWLIGIEKGNRPRSEFSKVLAIIDALDLRLDLSSPNETPDNTKRLPGSPALSTTEATQQFLARLFTRQSDGTT